MERSLVKIPRSVGYASTVSHYLTILYYREFIDTARTCTLQSGNTSRRLRFDFQGHIHRVYKQVYKRNQGVRHTEKEVG